MKLHFNKDKFTIKVIKHYDNNKRKLPWRDDPQPYKIWVSEIMAQQTRIETVIDYFNRFMKSYPTIKDLANAPLDSVLKSWEGLGYYSRAKNLHKTANIIVEEYGGIFPDDKKTLLALPGIGPYTAGAILSIAFNQCEPAIDGNFIRVAARIMKYNGLPRNAKGLKFQQEFWQSLICIENPGDFNQGIMDIGSSICRPNGEPLCSICPLSFACLSYKEGDPLDYPIKVRKKSRKIINKTILLLKLEDKFLFRKRPEDGLLSGLWEFPHLKGNLTEKEILEFLHSKSYRGIRIENGPSYNHIFSHREWHMTSYLINLDPFVVMETPKNTKWLNLKDLETYTIPTAFKPFLEMIKDESK